MKNNFLVTLVAALSLVAVAGSDALALPISGDIYFSGEGLLKLGGADSTPALADGIDFANPVEIIEAASTGDYAGLPGGSTATFTDLTGLNAFGVVGTTGPLSVAPLWTFTVGPTTYTFTLDSVTLNAVLGGTRVIEGLGTASMTGRDATNARFQLSTSGPGAITFSSITNVPDGGTTAALLGLVLVGFEGLRRRFRA